MSIETWRAQFLPLSVEEAMAPVEGRSRKKKHKLALKLAIQKWKGIVPDEMKWHEVTFQSLDDDGLLDAETCALCYVENVTYADDKACAKCPLYKSVGGLTCVDDDSPYQKAYATGNGYHMVAALVDALALLKQKD